MADFLARAGGNPGRSGHRLSIEAGRIVYDAREAVAELFHAADPLRVIFTLNATHALNMALTGLLRPGDHVVTSGIEHNAVMRPLRALCMRRMLGRVCDMAALHRSDGRSLRSRRYAESRRSRTRRDARHPVGRPQPRQQRLRGDPAGGRGRGLAHQCGRAAAGGRRTDRRRAAD